MRPARRLDSPGGRLRLSPERTCVQTAHQVIPDREVCLAGSHGANAGDGAVEPARVKSLSYTDDNTVDGSHPSGDP